MDGLKARLSFDAVAYDYDDEYLTIDTDTHTININNVSRLFGVQYDGNSKLIKFRIRNKLSEIQKMQDSIVYINWIDSKGVKGQSIAINKTINNDTCEFAWKVPFDALKNSGVLHFAMSAVMTKNSSSVIDQRWSTQIASVTTPDGIYIKSYTPSSEEEDRIAQIYNELSKMINKQNDNLQSQVNSLKEDLDDIRTELGNEITLTWIDGKYINQNGYASSDASYACTDFIEIPNIEKLHVITAMGNDSSRLCFFDENKKLSGNGVNLQAYAPKLFELSVPSGSKYFRMSFKESLGTYATDGKAFVCGVYGLCNDNSEKISSALYKVDVLKEEVKKLPEYTNLLDKSRFVEGGYIDKETGEFKTGSTNYYGTEYFIPLRKDNTYYFDCIDGSNFFAFYNEKCIFFDGSSFINLEMNGYHDGLYGTINPNVDCYIRVTIPNNLINKAYISSVYNKYTEYGKIESDKSKGQTISNIQGGNSCKNVNTCPPKKGAIITFTDDDGHSDVYTRLYPIFKAKNKKFGSAVITNRIGKANCMTLTELKECYDSGLLETMSHTHDVSTNLLDGYTIEEVEEQLYLSKKWLDDNGFSSNAFVYPQGTSDKNVRDLVRKYYECAYSTTKNWNGEKGYIDNYRIARISLLSWTTGNPTIDGIGNIDSLEYYKACIDKAIENNTWLVFMTHINQHDSSRDTIIAQLIDYADSLGVRILSPSEAFNERRNAVNIGDVTSKHLFIGDESYYNSYASHMFDEINATKSVGGYEKNAITLQSINRPSTNLGGFPTNQGWLETFRGVSDTMAMQRFTSCADGKMYIRFWSTSTSAWGNWIER